MPKVFCVLAIAISTALYAQAATYYVDASRPDDNGVATSWLTAKQTIQAAVNMTVAGDTVLVTNGVYNRGVTATPGYSLNNRVVITNAIMLKSVNGPEVTSIEGSGTNWFNTSSAVRCVYMNNGALEGFTLQNGATLSAAAGYNSDYNCYGGGINMFNAGAGAFVTNCVIRNCRAFAGGGAGYCKMINCALSGNKSSGAGGGSIFCTLNNCTLSGNTASYNGGGSCYGTLNNCTLSGNTTSCNGGGSADETLNNCTLSGNYAGDSGGGTFRGNLRNCIVWENRAGGTSDNHFNATLIYSCTTPLPSGTGNIAADPQFISSFDPRLRSGSPCLDAGANAYAPLPTDLAGGPRIQNGRVDMGAYEGWGSCVVVLNAQGGMVNPENVAATYGALYGDLPVPVKAGFVFCGWWTGAGGTGSQVTENDTVEVDAEHTLYAKWATDPFLVIPGSYAIPVGDTNAVQYAEIDSDAKGLCIKLGGSGMLDDGCMAGIEWRVTGPGFLAFDWNVSSEAEHDVLSFCEIGTPVTNHVSGIASGWLRVSVTLGGSPDTDHTFRWEYAKDPVGGFAGEDCGWINAISWIPLYELVVNNGAGGGTYTNHALVVINAAEPPSDCRFDRWTGYTDGISDVFDPSTTLVMPPSGVAVTATYVSVFRNLNIVSGSGSGLYREGCTVSVTADPDPLYKEFESWAGDAAGLLVNASSRTTSFIMPPRDATLTATYRDSFARAAGCYGRTFTVSGTEGGVSVDAVTVSPSGTASVQLGGTHVAHYGGFAAIETIVAGCGTVTFRWRLSSASQENCVRFLVDGVEITAISGTQVPWAQVTNRVEGAGATHTLRWEYVKKAKLSNNADAGWVDDIVWNGDVPNPVISPDIRTTAATNNVFTFTFLGERGIPYTIFSNATLSASGWAPMAIVPQNMGETNGGFRFETIALPPVGQRSGFYRVIGGNSP